MHPAAEHLSLDTTSAAPAHLLVSISCSAAAKISITDPKARAGSVSPLSVLHANLGGSSLDPLYGRFSTRVIAGFKVQTMLLSTRLLFRDLCNSRRQLLGFIIPPILASLLPGTGPLPASRRPCLRRGRREPELGPVRGGREAQIALQKKSPERSPIVTMVPIQPINTSLRTH